MDPKPYLHNARRTKCAVTSKSVSWWVHGGFIQREREREGEKKNSSHDLLQCEDFVALKKETYHPEQEVRKDEGQEVLLHCSDEHGNSALRFINVICHYPMPIFMVFFCQIYF